MLRMRNKGEKALSVNQNNKPIKGQNKLILPCGRNCSICEDEFGAVVRLTLKVGCEQDNPL
ncbi:hypothetical protein [Sulfuricurvum sp.]|uniref:hypothetical protein n=1 Tax=Sulfuricurvum sp. TaxID=2025608 RepID=UPI0026083F3C|nr:hypothetical protein [Sulfuricurvum sp.]MDD4950592.1 hypothetical protein [Sulfuricurvum sp.]